MIRRTRRTGDERRTQPLRPQFIGSLPSMRALRLPLLGTLVLAVTCVTVVATVANYFMVVSTPDAAVDSYLTQLERGSARQVLAPLSLLRDDPALQSLPNTVYRDGAHRPVSHRIVHVEEDGERATVEAEVRLDGLQEPRRVTYHPQKRVLWGPFNDSWTLPTVDAARVAVELPAAVDALEVNGHRVSPLRDTLRAKGRPVARTWQFEGLPGEYHLRFPDDSYLTAAQHTAALVPIPAHGTVSVDLPFRPAPRMEHEVDQEIRALIHRCETALRPEARDCPLPGGPRPGAQEASSSPSPSASPSPTTSLPREARDITWKLRSRPAVSLEADEKDPLTFHHRGEKARAEVRYTVDGQKKRQTVEFGIHATARTTGQSLTTEVRFEGR